MLRKQIPDYDFKDFKYLYANLFVEYLKKLGEIAKNMLSLQKSTTDAKVGLIYKFTYI